MRRSLTHTLISTIHQYNKSKIKVLGVTFDCMLNFEEHVLNTHEKLQKRNNILKKIARSDWGCTKDTLSDKAIGRTFLNYGAPIWASTISNTNWNHLQTQQNNALRTITGCVKMTDINDLHIEGERLPVKAHTEKLAEQFIAGSYQSQRADHEITSSTKFLPMRPTLNDSYREPIKSKNTKMRSKVSTDIRSILS